MKRKIVIDRKAKWGDRFSAIDGWSAELLRQAKIMVVGAGALGNEVVKNLTLLNAGNLLIVDFDIVEFDNLSKSILFREEDRGSQKATTVIKHLKNVNPEVKTKAIIGDIATDVGLGVFRRMDVVIGCLDNYLARLYINQHCFKVNKPWVDGALREMSGRYNVYIPGKSCFECSLTDAAWDIINFRMSCPNVAKRNASLGTVTTTPVSASIIAAFQVQEALKLIFNNENQSIAGEEVQYYGDNNLFLRFNEATLQDDCLSHNTYDRIVEARELSHNNSIAEVLTWLEGYFATNEVRIVSPQDIVLKASSSDGQHMVETAIYKIHLFDSPEMAGMEAKTNEEWVIEEHLGSIDRGFPYPERTLAQVGVPFLDILTVEANGDFFFVELSGDEDKLTFD